MHGLHQKSLALLPHLMQMAVSNVYIDKSGMRITIDGGMVINIPPANKLYALVRIIDF